MLHSESSTGFIPPVLLHHNLSFSNKDLSLSPFSLASPIASLIPHVNITWMCLLNAQFIRWLGLVSSSWRLESSGQKNNILNFITGILTSYPTMDVVWQWQLVISEMLCTTTTHHLAPCLSVQLTDFSLSAPFLWNSSFPFLAISPSVLLHLTGGQHIVGNGLSCARRSTYLAPRMRSECSGWCLEQQNLQPEMQFNNFIPLFMFPLHGTEIWFHKLYLLPLGMAKIGQPRQADRMVDDMVACLIVLCRRRHFLLLRLAAFLNFSQTNNTLSDWSPPASSPLLLLPLKTRRVTKERADKK